MKQGIQIKPLSPNNISVVPKCWLDGKDSSQFTLDGTYVDNWACKGSLAADVANTNNDTTRPTYDAATGKVTFTAANSTFLQSAAFGAALTQPNTIFIVYKITGDLSDTEAVMDGVVDERHVFWYISSKFSIYAGVTLTAIVTNTNDNIHVVKFNGSLSEYWINGVSVVSGNAGSQPLGGIVLGRDFVGGANADCETMEVIVVNSILPEAERVGVELYLKEKWSI